MDNKDNRITVRIPPDTMQELTVVTQGTGVNMSQLARMILTQWTEENQKLIDKLWGQLQEQQKLI